MESTVFEKQSRLKSFRPAQLIYILRRRIAEQGLRTTGLWVIEKIARRVRGYSLPAVSQVGPHLYVGGQQRPKGLAAMRNLGITAVVNMREESDDAARGVALEAYLWLPTPDDAAPSPQDLERGIDFIGEQIRQGHGVYIHCGAGVGRAPTMAAAYLVSVGAPPEGAWETLRRGRPFIRPTPPQLEAIRSLAARYQAGGSTSSVADTRAPALAGEAAESAQHTLEVREQLAYEQIAGDPALTGDLTDDEAQILLAWARQEVRKMVQATAGSDDAAARAILDPQVRRLRQQVRAYAEQGTAAHDALRGLLAAQGPGGGSS